MQDSNELDGLRAELRAVLKRKKISYRLLANRLDVSEITIKRFFTARDVSFQKLQQVCEAVDLSIFDLFEITKGGEERSFHLTFEQESFLCENESLYDFYILLLKYDDIEIVKKKMSARQMNFSRSLNQLAKIGLIEQNQSDSIVLRSKGSLTWISGGPLQKKYMRIRHERYLDVFEGDLDRKNSYFTSSQRFLLPESLDEMRRDLEFIAQKYRSRARLEEKVYPDEELLGVAWLIGAGEYKNQRGL